MRTVFYFKYTETNEQLSINTIASVLNSQVKYGPRNLKATLVTLDNTWLISWDKPESIDSEETTFSAITGYVVSVNKRHGIIKYLLILINSQ